MGLPELLSLVDELHEGGFGALTLNSAYDAGEGYDQGDLWCGLAASNLTKVNPRIGTDEDWDRLVAAAHGKNMAVMTWLNPSYFWTGSPSFKQAEHDAKRWGIDNLPSDSPARWFRWTYENDGTVQRPSDDSPRPANEGVWQWVWDEQAGAYYLSTWANQPTTDWTSLAWHAAIRDVLRYWIEDKGVDGFIFDYPDGYVATGSDSRGLWDDDAHLMREHLTDVVHELGGGRVAAFAETYQSPERTIEYGFDGSISDDSDHSLAVAFGEGVQAANAGGFEQLLAAPGGPDAITAQCWFADIEHCPISWVRAGGLHASWLPSTDVEDNTLNCFEGVGAARLEPAGIYNAVTLRDCFQLCSDASECDGVTVRWGVKSDAAGESHVDCHLLGGIDQASCDASDQAFSTFAKDAPAKVRLAVALSSATVGLTAVELPGDGTFWSNAPWPGSNSDAPFLHALKGTNAFGAGSLRVALPSAEGAYAVLRYDARRGGEAAITVFNLGSTTVAVDVDLSSLPTDDLSSVVVYPADSSWERLSNKLHVQLPAHGYALHSLSPLPRWESLGHLSCYDGGGASYAPDSSGDMLLGLCLLECLRDSRCEAVTVNWLPAPGAVSCYKRGGITPDECDTSNGADFTTFSISKAQPETVLA